MKRFPLLMLAAAVAVGCCCSAIEVRADEPVGYSVTLFDGKSLDGWKVTGCEALVEDGAILLKDGNGLVRTEHRYGDFVLELEWQALGQEKWDSGIYFRCELPPEGKPWPPRYQANLLKGQEGNVGGLKEAVSTGLTKPGEWNHFKLTVIGTTAAMEINGQPAWKADGLESPSGYIALQAEVPNGGQFKFRNIRITELGYKSLFNGTDLAGWEGGGAKAEACWQVEQGLLMCTGQKGPWLRSKEQYGDLNLRLEYKIKPGGNSGVYVRVPENGNHHGQGAGVEIQILDDAAERYAKLKPYQYTGSVYAVAPSTQHVGNPPGQWNRMEINASGSDYRITVNGVVIVNAKAEEFPQLNERNREGFLGLQNHSEEVWFRNLRIGAAQP
jgi:hypothetical protein